MGMLTYSTDYHERETLRNIKENKSLLTCQFRISKISKIFKISIWNNKIICLAFICCSCWLRAKAPRIVRRCSERNRRRSCSISLAEVAVLASLWLHTVQKWGPWLRTAAVYNDVWRRHGRGNKCVFRVQQQEILTLLRTGDGPLPHHVPHEQKERFLCRGAEVFTVYGNLQNKVAVKYFK